jgi:hypothetical protein
VGPRAGLDDVEKRKFLTLPELELRLLGRPARSQSLYRLSYPGSLKDYKLFKKGATSWSHSCSGAVMPMRRERDHELLASTDKD